MQIPENADDMVSVLQSSLVLGPIRWFVRWLLRNSRQERDPRRAPALSDIVTPSFSPLLVLRQYFSSLLAGASGRLNLILRRFGCESVRQFCAKHSDVALRMRRLILTADAWIFQRHWI